MSWLDRIGALCFEESSAPVPSIVMLESNTLK